jgi:hypothetical protein
LRNFGAVPKHCPQHRELRSRLRQLIATKLKQLVENRMQRHLVALPCFKKRPACRPRTGTRGEIGGGQPPRHAQAKERHVGSQRKHNHDRIVGALGRIEDIKPPPQPAGLDPDDRIDLWIDIGIAPQGLHRNGVTFDAVAFAGERLLNDEAQERREPVRTSERGACGDT